MPAGKRRMQPDEGEIEPKRVMTPTVTCESIGISPAFDPNRVLLRRVFYIGPEKTKYVSIGFYPSRNYQPLVELGGPEKIPILLADRHVGFLAEHLPALIEGLCTNERYACRDEDFRMNTTAGYRVARMNLGTQFISFKLRELKHLNYKLYMVRN